MLGSNVLSIACNGRFEVYVQRSRYDSNVGLSSVRACMGGADSYMSVLYAEDLPWNQAVLSRKCLAACDNPVRASV